MHLIVKLSKNVFEFSNKPLNCNVIKRQFNLTSFHVIDICLAETLPSYDRYGIWSMHTPEHVTPTFPETAIAYRKNILGVQQTRHVGPHDGVIVFSKTIIFWTWIFGSSKLHTLLCLSQSNQTTYTPHMGINAKKTHSHITFTYSIAFLGLVLHICGSCQSCECVPQSLKL